MFVFLIPLIFLWSIQNMSLYLISLVVHVYVLWYIQITNYIYIIYVFWLQETLSLDHIHWITAQRKEMNRHMNWHGLKATTVFLSTILSVPMVRMLIREQICCHRLGCVAGARVICVDIFFYSLSRCVYE